jgi:MFS family permease
MLLFATGYFGAQSLVTILITTGRGGSLTAAGIALTSGALGWSLASLAVPRLIGTSQRRAPRAVTGGLALAAVGIAALAAAGTGAVLPIAAWAIASIGVGFAYPALYRFCTGAPAASTGAPAASPEDMAAAVIVAESFGGLLGRSLGAGIVSVTAIAGVAPSAGLSAAYAFFAVAVVAAVAASTRLAPVKRYEDPRGADALLAVQPASSHNAT